MRAVTIDSDLATLFTFTPRKPPITLIQEFLRKILTGLCRTMAVTLAPADRRHGGETPLFRHRGAGHRPALCSYRPHRAGFAGTRRRTLLRPRRCDVWRRGAGRQASSPTWSLAGPLGSATRRPSSHELQTATGRHA